MRMLRELLGQVYPRRVELASSIPDRIRTAFCQQVLHCTAELVEIRKAHRDTLSSKFCEWKQMYSNRTCLACLARPPENCASCRHSFCDSCITTHSDVDPEEPWKFKLSKCLLCKKANSVEYNLKPSTAGVRALEMGGDGVSLQDIQTLQYIETQLRLPMPLREHFDIVIGGGRGLSPTTQIYAQY